MLFVDSENRKVEGVPFEALGNKTFLRLTVGSLLALAGRTKRDPNDVVDLKGLIEVQGEGDDRVVKAGDVMLCRDLLFEALIPGNPAIAYSDVDAILEELRAKSQAWVLDLAVLLHQAYAIGGFIKPDPNQTAEA